MTARALVEQFCARGVVLVADGNRLRCRPRAALSPDDLAALSSRKSEILAELRSRELRDCGLICFSCKESRFWLSIHGVAVCARCHPPADEKLVAAWIESRPGVS